MDGELHEHGQEQGEVSQMSMARSRDVMSYRSMVRSRWMVSFLSMAR